MPKGIYQRTELALVKQSRKGKSWIDYSIFAWCSRCRIKFIKPRMRCTDCGKPIRQGPYSKSK
jgi:rRNA maturation endonuclease Nob1